jgi:hypothetical protein
MLPNPEISQQAREMLAKVRAIVDEACDSARRDEREANRKSRETGNSDGAWFHHGRHMAAGSISEKLEVLEVELESALTRQPSDGYMRDLADQLDGVRESLRVLMLEQPTTGTRSTYSDGFAQGLAHSIHEIDRIHNPAIRKLGGGE